MAPEHPIPPEADTTPAPAMAQVLLVAPLVTAPAAPAEAQLQEEDRRTTETPATTTVLREIRVLLSSSSPTARERSLTRSPKAAPAEDRVALVAM